MAKDIYEKMEATIVAQIAEWEQERARLVTRANRVLRIGEQISEAQQELDALRARIAARG